MDAAIHMITGSSEEAVPRLLELIRSTSAGGAESLLLERFRGGAAGSRTVVLAGNTAGSLAGELSSNVEDLLKVNLRSVFRCLRAYARREYDAVVVHSPSMMIPVRLIHAALNRAPLLGVHHSVRSSKSALVRFCERITRTLEDHHLAVSEAVATRMRKECQDSVQVVEQGLSSDFRQRVEAAASEWTIEPPYILCVANARPMKDHATLLGAFHLIAQKRADVRLVLAGEGTDRVPVVSEVTRLDLRERVVCLGAVPFAARLMPNSACVVLSSRHEGLPVALMEAAVLGVPIISTDVGSCGAVVTDGVNGFLCAPGDPSALAARLELLMSNDGTIADNAKSLAEAYASRFTSSNVNEAIADLVLGSRCNRRTEL